MIRPCLVIPVYNHGRYIVETLSNIRLYSDLDIILVDDGSDNETGQVLEAIANKISNENLHLFRLEINRGKGYTVIFALRKAEEMGFSHALQVDADGQHDFADIPKILDVAENYQSAVIYGVPEYDESVPKGRLYGRYITHFFVWLETLSFQITDSMCGFRVYPVIDTCNLLANKSIGARMEFDTDILVKLYWSGLKVIPFKTLVIYPNEGASHFRLFHDNARISLMHTCLLLGMLPRIPQLLIRNIRRWCNYDV